MRRRGGSRVPWVFYPFSIVFFTSAYVLYKREALGAHIDVTVPESVREASSLAPLKHVTKSLSELGAMDELNPHVLFFNRIPKSGSETIVLLLQWLQGWNNFRHIRLKSSEKNELTKLEQETIVYEVHKIIRDEAVPLCFDREKLHFINFTSFDRQSPTFINLIRDPADEILSIFNAGQLKKKTEQTEKNTEITLEKCLKKKLDGCKFKDGEKYDLSIPYFCGQDEKCTLLNNNEALERAKSNVERYYSVVGILEELNSTLEVFETKIPYFFKGVQALYYKDLLQPVHNKNKKKIHASDEVKSILRKTLVKEYEFYDWIKSRLFKQLKIASGEHH